MGGNGEAIAWLVWWCGASMKSLRHRKIRVFAATGSVVLAGLLGACATGMADRPNLVAAGPLLKMPSAGTVVGAAGASFQGMVAASKVPVVVNVWASWCAPCRAEAPMLARAAKNYRGRVTFLGVLSDDSPIAAKEFMNRYGITYPSVVDIKSEIGPFLGVRGLPTTLVFATGGRLLSRVNGGISEQRLAAHIEEALRKK